MENVKYNTVEKNSKSSTEVIPYSPSAIVAIFNAATITSQEKKIIKLRGIFQKIAATGYGNIYYNRLKDESTDNYITLLTSSLLHNKLDTNTTIELHGFISRKLDKAGRIELQINFVDLIEETQNKYSDEEYKKIILINKKINKGFKDLDAYIKNKVFRNEKIRVKILMGKSGIIDADIKKGMADTISRYDIEFHRISLSSVEEIINKISDLDNPNSDIICMARGGGENMEIFEDIKLCEKLTDTLTIIASAIGHAENVSLFEKMADKKFITPTQFGNYLKEIYNNTIEEFENSKAKLIHDITTTLKINYDKQITNLNEKIISLSDLKAKEMIALSNAKSNTEELLKKSIEETKRVASEEKQSLNNQLMILRQEVERKNRDITEKSSQQQILNKNILDLNKRLSEKDQSDSNAIWRTLIIGLIIGFLIAIFILRSH